MIVDILTIYDRSNVGFTTREVRSLSAHKSEFGIFIERIIVLVQSLMSKRAQAERLASRCRRLRKENLALRDEVARLRLCSTLDELTGVYNKRGLECAYQSLISSISRGSTSASALAYIDLTGFKAINDKYGHAIGDIALVLVAEVFSRQSRPIDVIARLHGDEFVVLLSAVDVGKAHEILERMRKKVQRISHNGLVLGLDFSFGISMVDPRTPKSFEAILGSADSAMYATRSRFSAV